MRERRSAWTEVRVPDGRPSHDRRRLVVGSGDGRATDRPTGRHHTGEEQNNGTSDDPRTSGRHTCLGDRWFPVVDRPHIGRLNSLFGLSFETVTALGGGHFAHRPCRDLVTAAALRPGT